LKKNFDFIKGDFYEILRLLILISVTKGGFSNTEFTSLKNQFLKVIKKSLKYNFKKINFQEIWISKKSSIK
jgi:hypothetical protein